MIYVLATIHVRQGMREKFLEVLKANVPNVTAEKGCISYVPVVDVDSGIPVQEKISYNVVTLLEAWERLEDLTSHLKAPHMLAYREQVRDLVESVRLRVLAPA
jgi:quinol monooxygenase YgiN